MRQFILSALAGALLIFTPASASVTADSPRIALPAASYLPVVPAPAIAPAAPRQPAVDLTRSAPPAPRSALAPGQSQADYHAWLARSPENRRAVTAFRDYLAAQGLEAIVPIWQLVRTSSSWRQCAADRFEVAPADKWSHIAATLRFVRDEVVPAVGPVEALSAYRNAALNACSDGAPQSAHRNFFALDLTPVAASVSRPAMIRQICAAHARDGRTYNTGLGFYSGMRFHVDSNGYRRWGPDGRGASSPCAGGNYA